GVEHWLGRHPGLGALESAAHGTSRPRSWHQWARLRRRWVRGQSDRRPPSSRRPSTTGQSGQSERPRELKELRPGRLTAIRRRSLEEESILGGGTDEEWPRDLSGESDCSERSNRLGRTTLRVTSSNRLRRSQASALFAHRQ